MVDVNWVAVAISAVASIVIGSIWYHPSVFGKKWMELSGMSMDGGKNKGDMAPMYALMFVLSIITAYVLAMLIQFMGSATLTDGALAGAIAWVGFVFTSMGTQHFFSGKPWGLFALNAAHHLVSMIVMGIILVMWV